MTLTGFIAIGLLHLLAVISPGPAVIVAARTGVTEGLRTGAYLAMGLGLGAVIWASAALFGLGIIFAAAPRLLWALKLGGGCYLLWLAYGFWRDADKPLDFADTDKPPRTAFSAFRRGLFTQLTNPKPAIMFSAIFIGTIPQTTPVWVYGALLLVVFINELLWNTFIARIFSLTRSRTVYISLKSIIDKTFGGLLALLGVKIAII